MKIYYDIVSQMMLDDLLAIEEWLPIKKILTNDFINSNGYNITLDTNYWL